MRKLLFIISTILIVSCSQENPTHHDHQQVISSQDKQAQSTTHEISNNLTLNATDDMRFSQNQFTVKVGEEIVLTLTNSGVLPIETMGHNVVILDKDADVQGFANASAKAKETQYVSELYLTDIIAQTKMLGPEQTETIKFMLKEEGDYPFLCTFPGHWIVMKGTIKSVK